nr:reverse transcriptase domain-containing protein [Tanacetum cinerariifolium]
MLSGFFQNQASTLGTLPSNTIPNPKGEMKAITTRSEPDVPKTLPKPNISYPSRLNDQMLHEKATNQMEKFFQIFQDLHFDTSFADALLLMLKFAFVIKSLLANKDKLFELAKIPLNENCSAMLLKKLLEKLGDPDKFLIPCNFLRMDVCHALADLNASINLMPLFIWKNLSLPELTPTRMTLELENRSITRPKGATEDVFVKVGKFHFPTDIVVVDFEADPSVPVILGRSFIRTESALIDVYEEEITLRVNDKAEYAQEMIGFSNNSSGGNPTSNSEPIISHFSLSLTPFKGSDFILEEIEAYLKDESISLEINHADCDSEGDICLIEKLLNDDPFQLPPIDLKQVEVVKAKSSIEEPPELELKDLPSYLEYAYLEGADKLPVIIAKDLKDDEKEALLKVIKLHKRAIAWKITDIKGIDPRFCTHKILMEEDFKPAVNSQRWVNLKIHKVIKNEVIKPLDAGMIYLISDSPWVSPIHCCIDYRKLNDATRKDHFPLPFMDQMLERLAGNDFYCFLDGFSGYFQIEINPPDQEKTTFTCPYRTFAYRRMLFGLCNAPMTFQRCMMAIFHDMIEKPMEVFMDDFLEFSWTRRFIQDFSKIARPMTHLLEKETPFVFFKDCIDDFETLKKKLTEASILVVPDWNLPFELMCDTSDFSIGTVLGQRKTKHFQPIHYGSKTMTEAQIHYTTMEKERLAVVYAFEMFRPYLVLSKSIAYTDYSAHKYLLSIDFMGPFPSSRGNRYILVAVDYLSKWVEAKALPTNDARVIVKILKSLFIRFRTPRANISDSGTHFYNDKFAKVMSKNVRENRASWSEKLEDALWAFKTAYKTPIGCTPYKLVYEKSCHLPIELEHKEYWALKHVNFDLKTVGDHRKLQVYELNELHDQSYENSLIYKEKTKKLHDSKIKYRIFSVGD